VAVVGIAGAVLLALMARTVIDHMPLYDELLHVLSARGWLADGVPRIADGVYTRAGLFTRLVGLSMSSFGDTLVAARIPSLVAGMLLAFLVGAWTTLRAGWVAGAAATLVLCLVPATLQLSVFARFYTLHALVIFGVSAMAYEAIGPDRTPRTRLVLAIGALALLPLAWHLQSSTAIAVAAIALAVAAVVARDRWGIVSQALRRNPVVCALALAVSIGLGLVLIVKLGLWDQLREVPSWAAWAADKPQYYFLRLAAEMPLLWPLVPLAVVGAWLLDRRFALFLVIVFGVALAVHSIAAAKQVRYLYYALPFVAMLWGLGISWVVEHAPSNAVKVAACVAAALALLLSVEGQMAARLVVGRVRLIEALPYTVEPDWGPAKATLLESARSADRVVTSNGMKALYYVGRYDYELNVSIVAETDTRLDFGLDERTGRRAIGSPQAFRKVVADGGQTLVILEEETLGLASGVPAQVVAAIELVCGQGITPATGLRIYRCVAGPPGAPAL
jgi:hypothetical protein